MQDQPLGYYIKQEPTPQVGMNAAPALPVMPATASGLPGAHPTPTQPPKKMGNKNSRKIIGVLVILLFVVIGSLGVIISLRQQNNRAPVAPNAPESRPSANVSDAPNCTLSFDVPGVSVTPTPGTTPTPEASPTPGVTPTPTATPSSTPGATPTPAATPTPGVSPTPGVTPTPTPTPTIGCNNLCVTNSDCTNPDHICYNAGGTEVCRLATNPVSSSCSESSTPAPTPTPTIGCNDICSDNSDCSNTSHICYNSQCRLEENPENQYCARTTTTTTTQTADGQPELPEKLPVSGPGDWGNWLKVGLGGLVIGAVLLLFL